jgi:hypothetical protein
MSMDKLIAEVTELVEKEYGRAAAKFGCTNNSDHESYAILLEELEEAQCEVSEVHFQLQHFWELTKANDDDLSKYSRLLEMERRAKLAACELIQVTAMAKKAAITVCDRNALVELAGEAGARG